MKCFLWKGFDHNKLELIYMVFFLFKYSHNVLVLYIDEKRKKRKVNINLLKEMYSFNNTRTNTHTPVKSESYRFEMMVSILCVLQFRFVLKMNFGRNNNALCVLEKNTFNWIDEWTMVDNIFAHFSFCLNWKIFLAHVQSTIRHSIAI